MKAVVPLGCRFRPKEEELVKLFLQKRVRAEPLPWNGITDCDVYGDRAPWQIFRETNNPYFPPNTWYCFTRLKKKSKNRVSRIAASGTWHGDTSAVKIIDSETKKVIAFKKTCTFKIKGEGAGARNNNRHTSWIMHELSLAGDKSYSDIVLCKIKRKSKDRKQDQDAGSGREVIISENPFPYLPPPISVMACESDLQVNTGQPVAYSRLEDSSSMCKEGGCSLLIQEDQERFIMSRKLKFAYGETESDRQLCLPPLEPAVLETVCPPPVAGTESDPVQECFLMNNNDDQTAAFESERELEVLQYSNYSTRRVQDSLMSTEECVLMFVTSQM